MPETPFEAKLPPVILDDDGSRDARPSSLRPGNSSAWWIATIAALVALAAAYWWWQKQPPPPPSAVSPPAVEAPPGPAKAEPAIRHPIDDARAGVAAPGEDRDRLPALSDSDAPIRAALAAIPGAGEFERFFYPQEIVRRFVATVDNLPRRSVATQVMAAKPVPGAFVAAGSEGSLAISADNAARYAPYVRLVHAVDAKTLVALYVHFYPWFQQAYQDLGYPSGYFNDRLIDVIDNLLAAPEAPAPVALVQPHVLYQFADPDLEARSAGQKIMLRMGTNNAAQVRAKLRELRRLLTGAKSDLPANPPG